MNQPITPPPITPPPVIPKQSPPGQLSFGQYWSCHFAQTRGPWAFGVALGLIVVPVLSLLKPAIGMRGLVIVLVAVVVLSLTLLLIYTYQRLVAYFLTRTTELLNRPRSRIAPFGFTSLLLAIVIGPLVAGESFVPECGLLATLVPQLKEEQARLLRMKDRWEHNTTATTQLRPEPAEVPDEEFAETARSYDDSNPVPPLPLPVEQQENAAASDEARESMSAPSQTQATLADAESNLLKAAAAAGGIDAAWVPQVVRQVRNGEAVPAHFESHIHRLTLQTRQNWRRWESALADLRLSASEGNAPSSPEREGPLLSGSTDPALPKREEPALGDNAVRLRGGAIQPCHAHGSLLNSDATPPPVARAIQQKREVWKHFHESDSEFVRFVVMKGDIVESVVWSHPPKELWFQIRAGEIASYCSEDKTLRIEEKWTGKRTTAGLQLDEVHRIEKSDGQVERSIQTTAATTVHGNRITTQVSKRQVTRGSVSNLTDSEYKRLIQDNRTRISDDGKRWNHDARQTQDYADGFARRL
ncbi:MAG: hypothetical protein GXX96_24335 [Planctomycetaceae bacterium]|nr:hypothetical protein [Planctomycetaceae bacterium]